MAVPRERLQDVPAEQLAKYLARFDSVAEDLRRRDPETVGEAEREQLEAELDELCPYKDQICIIGGDGYYPIVDESGKHLGEEWRHEDGMNGKSCGVAIQRSRDGGEYYQPYHLFLLNVTSEWDERTHENVGKNYALLDKGANIVPSQTINAIYNSNPNRPVIIPKNFDQMLQSHSDWFRNMLGSRNFLRRRWESQRRFVDDYLAFATDTFMLEQAGVGFVASYCLRSAITRQPNVEQKVAAVLGNESTDASAALPTYDFLALHKLPRFKGMVCGFTTPERSGLSNQPLRRKSDMIDPTAGLCLAIELFKNYSDTPLRATDVIMLPLSSQKYDLTFHEPTTEWLSDAVH